MRDNLKEEAERNSEVFHQELQHSRKMMNGSMGEEFQPLSSPPRSSLRSGRSPTRSRGRVRGRVTFAQDCSSDYNTSDVSTPYPQDLQPHLQPHLQPYDAPLGRGQAPWTPPLETDPEPQDPVQAPKAWASECSHAHWPSLSSSLTQLLQPLASPPPRDTELDLEARTSRLLRLTSGQAYDLLSALGSPPAAPCLRETEQKGDGQNRGGGEQSGSPADVTPQCSEIALLKRKLTVTQQQLESLKKRLVEALKENYNLRLTSLKQDSSTTAETNCGRQWDRCLQRQVNALREQETHLRQLEQTMVLLQGNHRSLVSNNNSLLGHLNEHTTEVQSPESRESSQQTNLMTSTSEINS